MSVVLKVENVRKEFFRGQRPKLSVKEHFLNPFRRVKQEKFVAVDDLSFEIQKGEFFGIIGRNGSGKSTLLKLLAGVLSPTSGEIIVDGKLIPFLELGVGFNPDLTARENVFLNGAILGMTRKQLEEKFDDIIAFAEIEDFIDTQIKNFSSGMYVRLAFAIAMQAEADIYLIDEILAVGDFSFQQKCFNLFRELKEKGKTFVFVTHDLGSVRKFCTRAMYIKNGKQINIGDPEKVIKDYVIHDRQNPKDIKVEENIFGRDTEMGGKLKVEVFDKDDKPLQTTVNSEPITIRINYELKEDALKDDLIIGIGIYKDGSFFIYGTNTQIEQKLIEFKPKGSVDFKIPRFPLLEGHFGISAAIHNRNNVHYAWKENAVEFDIVKAGARDGLIDIDVEIK